MDVCQCLGEIPDQREDMKQKNIDKRSITQTHWGRIPQWVWATSKVRCLSQSDSAVPTRALQSPMYVNMVAACGVRKKSRTDETRIR